MIGYGQEGSRRQKTAIERRQKPVGLLSDLLGVSLLVGFGFGFSFGFGHSYKSGSGVTA